MEFETLEKQCWSYIRNMKTAMYYFYKGFEHNLHIFLIRKNLAEHWDLPKTGILYSKDVAFDVLVQHIDRICLMSHAVAVS
jgi:hypothetical protein